MDFDNIVMVIAPGDSDAITDPGWAYDANVNSLIG